MYVANAENFRLAKSGFWGEFSKVWKQFEFWCEGVIFSSLGLFGLASNLASIIAFLSPEVFCIYKILEKSSKPFLFEHVLVISKI